MAKHFLYLTNSRLVSIVTRGKRIAARREFAVSGAGIEEFQRYLAAHAGAMTHVFTDLAEEDFRVDTIPHVGAKDREAIFGRRLAQIYRNSTYRHGTVLGRESEGRRDDRVLYVAVTNGEVLRPWLDALERARVPLAGIHSVAVFSTVLIEELDIELPHALLVTFTPGMSLRQTYFKEGEFRFSRLTPIDLEEGQALGAMVAEEAARTWQYLDSLRHFGPDDRLEICVLLHRNDRPAIEPWLKGFPQIQYRVLDIEDVATKLGLKPAPLGSTAEELIVHLFLDRPGSNHFATPEQQRFAVRVRARRVLNAAAVAVLAAGLGWGGYNVLGLFEATTADQALTRQITELNREYEAIQRSMPSMEVGGATMRDAVAFYNGSMRTYPAVTQFVAEISETLARHPDVRLNQLLWQATDDPKVPVALPSVPGSQPPPVKAIARSGAPPAPAAAESADPPFAGGRYEVVLLDATVAVPNLDFRGALERAQRLAEDLERRKGVEARLVESPLETGTSFTLQARTGNGEPQVMESRFVLRIVRNRSEA